MKQTVIIEKIDGLDIVIGFAEPVIEPIETRKIVDELLFQTDEYKAIIEKQSEMESLSKTGQEALQKAYILEKKKGRVEAKNQFAIYNNCCEKFNEGMAAIKILHILLRKKHKELFSDNIVYCTPKGTEFIKTEDEIAILKDKKIPANHLLTLQGEFVENNRGRKSWIKNKGTWHETKIVKIGVSLPAGSKETSELTDSDKLEISLQHKKERIAQLNDSEKAEQKEQEISNAAALAAWMRSELEIQGDPDPLGKSTSEYDKQLADINKLYG